MQIFPFAWIMIKLRWALFVTYTIIQSITSREICSLHLTHPSAHTLGAVGSRHCGTRGAVRWGFGVLLKVLTSVVKNSCRSQDSNPQPQVTSPTLYPLGHDCPSITASIWRGMEVISLWHCSGVMKSEVALIAAFRSNCWVWCLSSSSWQ